MENLLTILFWLAIIIIAWFGIVRNIITIIIGFSQEGKLKSGQRLCHITSLLIYGGALILAIKNHAWIPIIIGIVLEYVFRITVRKSGEIVKKNNIA